MVSLESLDRKKQSGRRPSEYFSGNVVLLNATIGLFQGLEQKSESILALALLILIMWGLATIISKFPFRSAQLYHLFNLGSQLIAFFVITKWSGLINLTVENIIINGTIYVILYFLNVRMRQKRLNQLANAINEHLSKRDSL